MCLGIGGVASVWWPAAPVWQIMPTCWAVWSVLEALRAFIEERIAAKRAGRAAASFVEVANRPVALRPVRWEAANPARVLVRTATAVGLLWGLGRLFRIGDFHLFPLGLPLLALSQTISVFVRKEEPAALSARPRSLEPGPAV